MKETTRINVLGIGVSAVNLDIAVDTIDQWIADGQRDYVCVSGVHGVMESQRDTELQRIHNAAGLVTPDGMPLVWLLKLGGIRYADRVYGPDLMLALFERAQSRGYRHFFYGATEDTIERLSGNLLKKFPGSVIAGSYAPPFRPLTAEEDDDVVRRINQSGADIVWVGLSTPKQERWMADHVMRLGGSVLIGVGAAFDFHAGLKRQAPRWMQRNGLEWLFRLLTEPRRLARRYLTNIPRFVWYLMLDAVGLRRFPSGHAH
jgi:N-acetylglucosaminyldiphosphoundecaprenol N-acetyl-beta-D-mannosaminyltransferase